MTSLYGKYLVLILCDVTIGMNHKLTMEKFDFMGDNMFKEITPFYDCPDPCHCPSPQHADCSEADLKSVPHNISKSTEYLMLNHNKLESLRSECFFECPLIRTLNLQDNMLSDEGVPPTAFAPLHQLQHLLLSDNRLRSVPSDLPDSLKTLHLAGNEIQRIDPHAFVLKGQLRHLYLHDNQLTSDGIKRNSFKGLDHLEEMTLSNNFISIFPPIPSSAEVVYLQRNNIQIIPEGTFRRRRNVRVLFLQNNKISDAGLKRKSFVGLRNIEYLDLSDNELARIPEYLPTNLVRLHLERNKISNITKSSMDRLRKLEYLLLHQNEIVSRGIEPGAFSRLNSLLTLHIFNNKMSEIPPMMPRRVHNLVILQNDIRSIYAETFSAHDNLEELDLRYNQLTNHRMARGVLRKLKSLVKIDFTGNKLRAVPLLPRNVTTLMLKSNHISRIPPRSIARMPRLRHLAMGNNKLENIGIPTAVFKDNFEIAMLDLSENLLRAVPKYLPPNVEFIYLQNNLIERIPRNSFFSALKLKAIFLQDNQLLPETVSKSAFTPLRFLQRVDVTWRRLRPEEHLATTGSRRRRETSRSIRDNGWTGDKCSVRRTEACHSGLLMVLPARKRRRVT